VLESSEVVLDSAELRWPLKGTAGRAGS